MKLMVNVNNLPSCDLDKYTVVRYADGGLWYYGTYSNRERAEEVADELGNGLVIESE